MLFWIIGAGTFGSIAAETLIKKEPSARITLVDSDPDALSKWQGRVDAILTDGIDFLVRRLDDRAKMENPDWIIPAIPIHIAYEWTRLTLDSRLHAISVPVPKHLDTLLPNAIRGRGGELYVSHATSMCPENCPAHSDICTATGKPRGTDLYKMLEQITLVDHQSVVVRSRQLAPGVGGYQVAALMHARAKTGMSEGRILMSTACRCHGVVHALQIAKR